ncbi:MAG: hypothetical protein LBD53_04100 [Tannerella sp.]|nr:hypothetical protein [Tannerella sp.]
MKKICLFKVLFVHLYMGMTVSCTNNTDTGVPVKVELLSSARTFDFDGRTASATLNPQSSQADITLPDDPKKGFTLKFSLTTKPFKNEETVLEIHNILTVRLRQHDRNTRDRQNYPAFKMPDNSCPVLEAALKLKLYPDKDEIQDMIVGIPLAMLDEPFGKHEIVLNFSGVCWTLFVDGKLSDNDFAIGYPLWEEKNSCKINPDYTPKAEFYYPALTPKRLTPTETPSETPSETVSETSSEIQYWTPTGHNAWVGDVATIYHKGRYHVFYLYDRRHHAAKFGRGGHYFEHLSTTDFKTWTEHEPATPIEEQWETFGTGTPFVFDHKLCISYGLHTTRIYPHEQTNLPMQWDFIQKHGLTGTFNVDLSQKYPAGATYSISDDGIAGFKKTGVIFHPCENPSVYVDPDGKLKLLANYQAKGTWESQSVDQGWRCLNKDFPPGGDCTFFFRWGKFDYIIGGFVNQWIKPAGTDDSLYVDLARQGLDFYDGTGVPAVSQIHDKRFVMAGWMPIRGWGGPLIIRELTQFPDGRIGTKWMDEITPQTGEIISLASSISDNQIFANDNESFLLSFQVVPAKGGGKFGIVFSEGNNETNACELQICSDKKRAQFAAGAFNGFSAQTKSLREGGSNGLYPAPEAIENLIGVDKPFTVRVIVKGSDKLGGSLIDVEIAGQRTLITYRPDLTVKQLLFRTKGVELKHIRLGNLINKF